MGQTTQSTGPLARRVLRDMNDGILILDARGHVEFINDKGKQLLGLPELKSGDPYALVMAEAPKENDAFHQFVLEAVYDKESSHSGDVDYVSPGPGGARRTLNMTTSFLLDETSSAQTGIVVVFSDVTELEHLRLQRKESSSVFAALMGCICVYLFIIAGIGTSGVDMPKWVGTQLIQGIAVIMFLIIWKTTSFSLSDMGLRMNDARRTLVVDVGITLAGLGVLVGGKMLLQGVSPGYFPTGAPFWDFSVANFSDYVYPATVVLQEFLSRGVMQGSLGRIFTGKHAEGMAVVVSSLIFGVLHISYGFMYMAAAFVLSLALGSLYSRQKSIWGLCIIHYVLGEAATFLLFI